MFSLCNKDSDRMVRFVVTSLEIVLLVCVGYRIHQVDINVKLPCLQLTTHPNVTVKKEEWVRPVVRFRGIKQVSSTPQRPLYCTTSICSIDHEIRRKLHGQHWYYNIFQKVWQSVT